jgi:hypothetical protein
MKDTHLTETEITALENLAGKKISTWRDLSRQGGYTTAVRKVVAFEDGSTYFAKIAREEHVAGWMAIEALVYRQVEPLDLPYIADFVGYADLGPSAACLLLQDLSGLHWQYDWTWKRQKSILKMLDRVAALLKEERCDWSWVGHLSDLHNELCNWQDIIDSPEGFLGLGLCSYDWWKKNRDGLLKAEGEAVLSGDDLLHFDVRSDNICFDDDDRPIIVDWNWILKGNGRMDELAWLPSLIMEGGTLDCFLPLSAADGHLLAMLAGFWAACAPLPDIHPSSTLRSLQLNCLKVSLSVACGLLGLEHPDLYDCRGDLAI